MTQILSYQGYHFAFLDYFCNQNNEKLTPTQTISIC